MAELTRASTSECCTGEEQAACCEPSEKDGCCAPQSRSCGCSAGTAAEPDDVREQVRERYAAAARAIGEHRAAERAAATATSCRGAGVSTIEASGEQVFGSTLYDSEEAQHAPESAVAASLGCGVPTAVADLRPGEVVLDLGSGAGADVLISARRVSPGGRAIGLDMTDEMLELARANATEAGVENVEFLKGEIESIPLPDSSVDVVISNCVINLSADKAQALREAARVLKPGGRFAVSDVIADPAMDDAARAHVREWSGCIAGALTGGEYERMLGLAGFEGIEIRETHRVHERAAAAIIRARKSAGYRSTQAAA